MKIFRYHYNHYTQHILVEFERAVVILVNLRCYNAADKIC